MLQSENRITIRQTIIIFIITTLSPAIRVFPAVCSEIAGVASWLAPVFGALGLYLLIWVLGHFFKSETFADLGEVYDAAMGKFGGVIMRILYLAWSVILFLFYTRYYAERLVVSIFKNTDMRFFIAVLMIIVFIAIRGKIETFARFCEIAILLLNIVMVVFFIFLLPSVRIEHLFPITYHDLFPTIKSAYPVLSIWVYITFVMFLGKYIKNKNQFAVYRRNGILFLSAITTGMLVFVIGTLGHETASRMSLPFFSANKMIVFMESLDRFESILLSVWVISDFIIITLFALVVMHIAKSLFRLTTPKYLSFPLALAGYFGSLRLVQNRFELEAFSNYIGLHINFILGFILPLLVFGIGKLRKKF